MLLLTAMQVGLEASGDADEDPLADDSFDDSERLRIGAEICNELGIA